MMIRIIFGGLALVWASLLSASVGAPASEADSEMRALPMQFTLHREGPAEACGKDCKMWISASGAITPDTPRDFESFVRGRDMRGAVIALDSDGGSVIGALALGRAIRRLGMSTTVGKVVDPAPQDGKTKSTVLQPDAYCGSMCTFVLLGGVERHVPPEAHVLVHQIWLGDRRDDPTAATYSAEDLALVQRDIGRIVNYTTEMSGSSELLAIMLKIPPWEPMYELSRAELHELKLVSDDDLQMARKISGSRALAPVANGKRMTVGARSWSLVTQDGTTNLMRKHPLTFYGEDVGSFELSLACGTSSDHYVLTYSETRKISNLRRAPENLRDVELTLGDKILGLKVTPMPAGGQGVSRTASGSVPAALIKSYASIGKHSLTIEAFSGDNTSTVTTLGNAGLARSLAQLASSCGNSRLHKAAVPNARATATAGIVTPER
jgi:hypothetical protein